MKRAVLISDLHMGVGRDFNVEDFYSDVQFKEFMASPLLTPRASVADELELILVGDVFDLWQTALPGCEAQEYSSGTSQAIPLGYTEREEVARVHRICEQHPMVLASLREFVARPGCRVTFVYGNHDHSLCSVGVQEFLKSAVDGEMEFVSSVFREDLRLFAEHGCQGDDNNSYRRFGVFPGNPGDEETPGYFFVKLFWNRLEMLDPNIENSPGGWRKIWHYLKKAASHPRLLAKAIRFYWQYRRDGRVPRRIALSPDQITVDGPELLVSGESRGSEIFSSDPIAENAFREAYHESAEVKEEVDQLRGHGAGPVPLPSTRLPPLEGTPVELGGQDDVGDARQAFRTAPTGRANALSTDSCRFVVFGHTHQPLERRLDNGAWYFNSGCWLGKNAKSLTVVSVEQDNGPPSARFGRFAAGRFVAGEPRI